MHKEKDLQRIVDCGVVAIVRFHHSQELVGAAQPIKADGVDVIEFTMTTPNAPRIIEASAKEFGEEVLLGAGTVLDPETARAAILSGARFIVSPTLNPKLIELCHRYSAIVVPGTLTPTEILTASELGADLVKVFPAAATGPGYIEDILAPLPQARLLPTGGVSLDNVPQFIKAGATAVAAGDSLVEKRKSAGCEGELYTTSSSMGGDLCNISSAPSDRGVQQTHNPLEQYSVRVRLSWLLPRQARESRSPH